MMLGLDFWPVQYITAGPARQQYSTAGTKDTLERMVNSEFYANSVRTLG